MFELTKKVYDSLRSQFASLKNTITADDNAVSKRGRHSKYMPFVFTEHGVAMLASVLGSDKAVEMNIAIIRAFISLRQLAAERSDFMEQLRNLRAELYDRIDMHDAQLTQIYDALENLPDTEAEKKAKEEAWKNLEPAGFQ